MHLRVNKKDPVVAKIKKIMLVFFSELVLKVGDSSHVSIISEADMFIGRPISARQLKKSTPVKRIK